MAPLRTLIRCLLAASVVLLAGIPPGRLLAHADYERSEPPADAVVAEAPARVAIYFTQDLFRRQGMNGIEVYAADGARVDLDDATIDDDNRRLMTVSLAPALAAGPYNVRWLSLSAEDGHEGEGAFTFTVAAGDTTITTTPVTSTETVTVAEVVTATVVATGEVEAAESVTPEVSGESTAEPAATAAPTTPPAAPASPSIPCLGGAAPLGLALGLAWIGRRRTGHSPW